MTYLYLPVVMREGSRGHYLAACYLEDAADIVRSVETCEVHHVKLSECVELREDHRISNEVDANRNHLVPVEALGDLRRKVEDWERIAATYNEHGGSSCPGAEPFEVNGTMVPGLCSDCEFIHETADEAESELSDRGYVTWWNDGFTIHKADWRCWAMSDSKTFHVGQRVQVASRIGTIIEVGTIGLHVSVRFDHPTDGDDPTGERNVQRNIRTEYVWPVDDYVEGEFVPYPDWMERDPDTGEIP